MKHLNIRLQGKVQGVFFRSSAHAVAQSLNITGFVQNQPDKSVSIEVEGEPEALDEFIKWCHKGPPLSKIEKVEVWEGPVKNFPKFQAF